MRRLDGPLAQRTVAQAHLKQAARAVEVHAGLTLRRIVQALAQRGEAAKALHEFCIEGGRELRSGRTHVHAGTGADFCGRVYPHNINPCISRTRRGASPFKNPLGKGSPQFAAIANPLDVFCY